MRCFISSLLFLFGCSCLAAAQTSYFEKIFGDTTDNCSAVSLVQLSSGSILVATNNLNITNGTNVIKLYKFDASGNELMQVAYPTTNNGVVNKMKAMPDGTILFAGISTDSTGISDGMLMKTDTSGVVIWSNTIGRALTDESLQGISFTPQNEILCSGYTKNILGAGHSFYLAKMDTAGILLWSMDYSTSLNSYSDAVIGLTNGDIIISGDRQLVSGNYTNTIIHADSMGVMTWDLEIPSLYNNGCKNDLLTANGDIMIVGESATASSFNFDPAITRIDTAGTILWSNVYNGSPLSTDALLDIIEPIRENYLVVGYALNPTNSSADVMLMRIDSAGNELARVYFGDTSSVDIGYALINNQFQNGCYISGTTVRNGLNRGYLIYTNLLGIQTGVHEVISNDNDWILYPNPSKELIRIVSSTTEKFEIRFYDFMGKHIALPLLQNNIFSVATLTNGIYFATIQSGQTIVRKSFVVMH